MATGLQTPKGARAPRERGSPSGQTPTQNEKRRKKRLFDVADEELEAVTYFGKDEVSPSPEPGTFARPPLATEEI